MHADRPDTTMDDTWHALLENPAVGLALCDLQCVIQHANPVFASLFGLDVCTARGQALLRLASPHALEETLHNLRRACSGETRAFIFHGRHPHNLQPFAVMMAALPLASAGRPEGVACLAFALTGPAGGGDALTLLDSLGEAAAILDDAGHILWTNPAFTRITGYDLSGLTPSPVPFLPAGTNLMNRARPELTRNGFWQGEVEGQKQDGTRLALLASVSPLPEQLPEDASWLLLLSDVSHHRNYAEQLERMVHHDTLTGLLNREAFRERVANALYRCRDAGSRLAVLFLDLDGFKAVNDSHGHKAGDRLLGDFSKRLRALAHEAEGGVDVARLGGDEFAVLIPPQTDPLPQAESLCRGLLALFDVPFSVSGQQHRLSVSIGASLGPKGHETASDLLHCADQAMYRAKRKGGRRFFIQHYPTEGADDLSMQIIDFEQAIRHQQIEAHFQPIVDLDSGAITAIEARVRWNGGIGQQLTAADVLRAAQQAEANWLLDHAVLEQVVVAMDRLATEAVTALPVAVNISAATCANDTSAAQLEGFLSRSGLKPEQLRLEFPCEALSKSPGTVVPLLQRLAAKGHAIAIDHVASADFKATHLNEVPVQAIKLDEDLVKQAPGDAASAGRIRDICLAAQKQSLRVGAEGVVRLDQLEFLRQAGCHEGQGPLISRPSPLDHLLFLLKKGRCW